MTTRFGHRVVQVISAARKLWSLAWGRLGSIPVWQKLAGLIVTPVVFTALVMWLYAPSGAIGAANDVQRGRFALILVTTGVLGVALSAGLGFALTRPMHGITDVIKRIEQGDLAARVIPWADDEIGAVQRAFNGFLETLEKSQADLVDRNTELTFLNDLSALVSLGRDVEQLVRSALPHVASIMGANRATLCLPSKDGSVTYFSAGPDLPELLVATEVAPPARGGVMDHVMNTGGPTLLRNVATSDLPHGHSTGPVFAVWIATPLRVQDLTIGALGVGKHHDEFVPNAPELLDAIGLVVGIGLFNAQLMADLGQSENDLRSALRKAVQVQEDERRRLSRELHDETGQALTSMLLHLKSVENETDIDVIHDRIAGMRYITSNTLEEVRRLSRDLRPALLDDLGLVPTLEWLTKRHGSSFGYPIALSVGDLPPTMPGDMEIAVFRIVQESLTNIARHAEATRVEIAITHQDGRVVLTIEDNGKGMDTAELRLGLGLIGIRERVDMLGGQTSVTSTPGAGTRIIADMPLREAI